MEFRDLFNHVNDTKYDEYQEVEATKERKITRNTNRKKHGLKESRMLKRTRMNEDSFETYYKKYRDKPMLRQSYENYAKDQYKSEIKPVSFRKWMKGLWEDDQTNESRKVHEQIRRRRKEKMKLREATIDEGTVKGVKGIKGVPGVKGSRGVKGVKGVTGIKSRKKMNETLKFKDGMEFDTSGDLRVEKRKDGYYVVGKGRLMAVDSKKEGDDYIKGKNESVNEGMYSWKLPDGEPIYSTPGHQKTVYMLDDKGNKWQEDNYEGYGVFGGKDYFDLVAEMNGVTEVPKGAKDNFITGGPAELRDSGIELYYEDNSHRNPDTKIPRFTTDPDATYESLPDPDNDPDQGWFNGELPGTKWMNQ